MRYKKLGRTGLDVSLICLGTMTWGRQNTQEQAFEQMDYALEQGVNFFDTAELYAVPPTPETYGKTETIIGNWFEARQNRDEVILATKCAGARTPWIRDGDDINRQDLETAIDGSLKRLQTDYIDLYQLHWPNRRGYAFQNWDYSIDFDYRRQEENFLEVLETLNDFVKQGKIRFAGLSNETAWGTMKYLQLAEQHNLPRMVSIQNEYSLLHRPFDLDMKEVAVAEDIGLLAWSPLATGMLSGKYLNGNRPAGSRWPIITGDGQSLTRDTKAAQDAVQAYIDIADQYGIDVCQMALAFINDQPFVTANIIGATTMDQLKSNIASVDLVLSDEIKKKIHSVYSKNIRPY